jgi:MFS family permease
MGDRIVRKLGATRIILFGGLTAAAGLFLATFAPSWQASLLGYALVGAGCSNIVPVLYTAVGKQTVMPESIAVPAITTLGYAGILAGPAVIGFVAHASSLSFAFGLMAVLLVAVAIGGKVLKVYPQLVASRACSRRIRSDLYLESKGLLRSPSKLPATGSSIRNRRWPAQRMCAARRRTSPSCCRWSG